MKGLSTVNDAILGNYCLKNRQKWISGIDFLERQGKTESAAEMRDILELVDEAVGQGCAAPELAEWVDSLEPVLDALESWRNGRGKEKLFDVYWREYRDNFKGGKD